MDGDGGAPLPEGLLGAPPVDVLVSLGVGVHHGDIGLRSGLGVVSLVALLDRLLPRIVHVSSI